MPTFSRNLEQSLHRALALANERHHEYATLEHLLLALLDDQDAAAVMRACNVDLDKLRRSLTAYLESELENLVSDGNEDSKPTAGFQRVIQRAVIHVQSSGREEVTGANVLVAIFAERLVSGRPAVIYGDGEQTRDFTYVDDVVDLVIKTSRVPGAAGKVFNAGNGNRYSLNEIWATLQKIEGVSIPAQYGPVRAGDVRDSQADTTAAVHELGHSPRFTIENGLRRTLHWYRESLVTAAKS